MSMQVSFLLIHILLFASRPVRAVLEPGAYTGYTSEAYTVWPPNCTEFHYPQPSFVRGIDTQLVAVFPWPGKWTQTFWLLNDLEPCGSYDKLIDAHNNVTIDVPNAKFPWTWSWNATFDAPYNVSSHVLGMLMLTSADKDVNVPADPQKPRSNFFNSCIVNMTNTAPNQSPVYSVTTAAPASANSSSADAQGSPSTSTVLGLALGVGLGTLSMIFIGVLVWRFRRARHASSLLNSSPSSSRRHWYGSSNSGDSEKDASKTDVSSGKPVIIANAEAVEAPSDAQLFEISPTESQPFELMQHTPRAELDTTTPLAELEDNEFRVQELEGCRYVSKSDVFDNKDSWMNYT